MISKSMQKTLISQHLIWINMKSKEIYYIVEKIKKTSQGYIFFIQSSQGTNFEMHVSKDQFDRFDIDEGERIDDKHFVKLREENLFDNARRQAFALLSYGENNKKMLISKLIDRGFSKELSQNVADYMEHRGYIDEEKQMGLLLETYLKKKFGKIKITRELISKGYKREAVAKFVQDEFPKIDFAANCAWIIEHKYSPIPKDQGEVKKMIASLMNYGYSISDIKEGIKIYTEGVKNGD